MNRLQWRTQEKISGGVQGRGSGLVGSPGAEPQIAKNAVFSPILQRNYKTTCSIFARLDEKHNFEKILKICKKFPKKIAKTAVFSPICLRNYKTMR